MAETPWQCNKCLDSTLLWGLHCPLFSLKGLTLSSILCGHIWDGEDALFGTCTDFTAYFLLMSCWWVLFWKIKRCLQSRLFLFPTPCPHTIILKTLVFRLFCFEPKNLPRQNFVMWRPCCPLCSPYPRNLWPCFGTPSTVWWNLFTLLRIMAQNASNKIRLQRKPINYIEIWLAK